METLFDGAAFRLLKDGNLGILEFDLKGERVNKYAELAMREMGGLVDRIVAGGDGFKALYFRSAKKNSFIVGADLNLIRSMPDTAAAKAASAFGQVLFSKIEDLKIPTIVAIEGPCMGGGTELSLPFKFRVCSDHEKTVIALPEVKLGFLPGWGGTYRLPRLVGLPAALDMMLTGKGIRPDKAVKMGLVDLVIPAAIFEEKSLELARGLAAGKGLPGRKPRLVSLQEKVLSQNPLGRRVIFAQARKGVMKATFGNYPAPLRILDLLSSVWGARREKWMEAEATGFSELWATPVSKNLVALFFLTEDNKKRTGSSLSEEEAKALPPLREMAVLGAGVMGGGIAAVSAAAGLRTTMKDIKQDFISKGLQHARKIFEDELRKRRLKKPEFEMRMGRIRGQLDYKSFHGMDLVIEAVVEDLELKKKVFAELETVIRPDCVVASNTSSLRLSDMAVAFKDSSRFVGLHFFNPVHKMPLVEVVTHDKAAPAAVSRAVNYVRGLGKTPIVCKDGPGFLVNRLLMPWLGEAGWCLSEGIPTADMDRILKKFGMPMGPCELLDEIGLDVACKVGHILEKAFGERSKASPILDRIMDDNKKRVERKEAPRLGRKSGVGLYKWDRAGGRRGEPDVDDVEDIIFEAEAPKPPEYTAESLVRRMIYPMINEAAIALDEGIVASAAEADLAMIYGTGFPPFRGGLLRYADAVGIGKIQAELERLAEIHGKRIGPSESLKNWAKRGRFYS